MTPFSRASRIPFSEGAMNSRGMVPPTILSSNTNPSPGFAGSMAIKEAVKRANPVILEPIMNVEVVCPNDYMGDILGDLSARRGKIGGMTQRGEAQVIAASVPLSEMFGYSTKLRSQSQGRAVYSMEFSHYEEVPKSKAEEIMSKVKA